jgi:hypothetical protein
MPWVYVTSQPKGIRKAVSWTDIKLTTTTRLLYTKENTFLLWGVRNNTSQHTRKGANSDVHIEIAVLNKRRKRRGVKEIFVLQRKGRWIKKIRVRQDAAEKLKERLVLPSFCK